MNGAVPAAALAALRCDVGLDVRVPGGRCGVPGSARGGSQVAAGGDAGQAEG